MVDLIIPLGSGSRSENDELRLFLRSVERNGVGVRNVENGNLRVALPVALRSHGGKRRIVPAGGDNEKDSLLTHLARAYAWQKAIDEGRFVNGKALANALGIDLARVFRTLRLTRLSPTMVHRIITGDYPATLTSSRLRENIPVDWDEQERELLRA